MDTPDLILYRDCCELEENYNSITGRLICNFGAVQTFYTCENYAHAITSGDYKIAFTRSPKFSNKFPYHNIANGLVPCVYNRKYPLSVGLRIHIGNTPVDSLGCILIGDGLMDKVSLYTGIMRTYGVMGSLSAYTKFMRSIELFNPKFNIMTLKIVETANFIKQLP